MLHVALGPVQVGVGEVDGDGLLHAGIGRIAGRGAGVGEQVEEEALAAGVLAHEAAGDAVVEEDARIQVIVEVDGEGEAALLDEGEPAGADIARGARTRALAGAVGCRAAASAAGFAPLAVLARGGRSAGLLAVLRAAARADTRLGEDVIGIDLQDARGEREDVEQARLGQGGIDLARCGVFGDDEPAPGRCGAALVQVDCRGVVGQVRVVNAVASHAFALRPLAAQLGDLAQAAGKLLGLGDEDGAGLAVAQVDEDGGGGGGDVGFDGVVRGRGALSGHVALSGGDCAVRR